MSNVKFTHRKWHMVPQEPIWAIKFLSIIVVGIFKVGIALIRDMFNIRVKVTYEESPNWGLTVKRVKTIND